MAASRVSTLRVVLELRAHGALWAMSDNMREPAYWAWYLSCVPWGTMGMSANGRELARMPESRILMAANRGVHAVRSIVTCSRGTGLLAGLCLCLRSRARRGVPNRGGPRSVYTYRVRKHVGASLTGTGIPARGMFQTYTSLKTLRGHACMNACTRRGPIADRAIAINNRKPRM